MFVSGSGCIQPPFEISLSVKKTAFTVLLRKASIHRHLRCTDASEVKVKAVLTIYVFQHVWDQKKSKMWNGKLAPKYCNMQSLFFYFEKFTNEFDGSTTVFWKVWLLANPNFWQILGEKLFSLILPICNREEPNSWQRSQTNNWILIKFSLFFSYAAVGDGKGARQIRSVH